MPHFGQAWCQLVLFPMETRPVSQFADIGVCSTRKVRRIYPLCDA